MDFKTRYAALNANQKQAVDTIEGPVMVVAGPGTGKTELLSLRVANILQQTDTPPESILCLTFTESGAHAMRERLAGIIGKDAYKVAIHTFHSFGSEIINRYSEFFYQGAQFRPADELAVRSIITKILDELDHTNPLKSTMNGEYTHLNDIISTISDLKRSGLTGDELIEIIDQNEQVLDAIEKDLSDLFSRRVSASTLAQLIPIAHTAAELDMSALPGGIASLESVVSLSLAQAIDEASEADSTKPVTAWKNKWLTKNGEGDFVFKDRARHLKLRAVADIYVKYLAAMHASELYDYDDMILRVVHGMEIFDELRFNLQEQYQYVMVDEFQDTNLAQLRILDSLTNNIIHGDTPNILVVGDDDQAIYSFQGADSSNISTFRNRYTKATLIPLVDNYRSTKPILATARTLITQGVDRLENQIDELDKTLTPHVNTPGKTSLVEFPTVSDERTWIVESIRNQISRGTPASSIAVLARRHHEIVALLPYFAAAGIEVAYERRDNVLELEPIVLLERLARVVTAIASQQLDEANALLPELLAHPAWSIDNQTLWRLSLRAYESRTPWLEVMGQTPALAPLQEWLIAQARLTQTEPLETRLDTLIGSPITTQPDTPMDEGDEAPFNTPEATPFVSPLFNYFFSDSARNANPNRYITFLEGLRTIRSALRDHYVEETPTLKSFLSFTTSYRALGGTLTSIHKPSEQSTGAVHLMTAHKSKGLEFDHVYVVGAIDSSWGERVRIKHRLISYPANLPLAPAGDSADERLRLFFVAATRAKQQLIMTYSQQNDAGKATERAGFLLPIEAVSVTPDTSIAAQQHQAEQRWYTQLLEPQRSLETLLAPTLERYKLSATHLGNFLDVTRGGPHAFLINNLLRFPQAMSPAAAYGSAIHEVLQKAHSHLAATGNLRAVEDILHDYETTLTHYRLNDIDREHYSKKGIDTLQAFLSQNYQSFTPNQKVELNFAGQQSMVGAAHLTGKLDLVDINAKDKTMIVTDYKTGHPSRDWKGRTEYEKIKLHRYRQQLLFYKLLVENSRDYSNYTVTRGVLQFVEPTHAGDIIALSEDINQAELDEFTALLEGVWRHITTLSLPNTDTYEPTLTGIQQFERDIIDNTA